MSFETSVDAPGAGLWLLPFAVSLLCLFGLAFETCFPNPRRSYRVRLAARVGLAALCILALADLVASAPGLLPGWELGVRVVVLAGGAVCAALILPRGGLQQDATRRISWGLLIVAPLMAGWSASRFYASVVPTEPEFARLDYPDREKCLTLVENSRAFTDLGREIPIYEYNLPEDYEHVEEYEQFPQPFENKVIVTSPNDRNSNCHGWVFADGKFVIRGSAVDAILADNGYRPVSEPRVGDVILYRDSEGIPSHTGVVKALGNDGFVLIESKWGFLGRYLHEPKDQCYSRSFEYYRADRQSHLVRLDVSPDRDDPGGSYESLPSRELAKTGPDLQDPKVLGAE